MKRILVALLAFTMLLSSIFALPACAETVLKDGIEVMLTTDKESYDSLDVIDAKLTVKNTNSFDVENVSMEIKAPEGYMLTSDGETKIGELPAGETQQQQTGMRDTEAPMPALPQTGDNSHGMLWGLLFVMSSAAVCVLVLRHPQAKRIISLLLCVALVAPYMLDVAPALAAEDTVENHITVEKKVSVGGESVTLMGLVTYDSSLSKTFAVAKNLVAAPAEDFYYFEENGGITLRGYKGNEENLVIPAEIDGKPVTTVGIGNRAEYSYDAAFLKDPAMLKTLVLPDTVKKIGAEAFGECSNLTSIQFPYGSLEYIGGAAFAGCASLTEVSIHSAGDLGISSITNFNLDGWEDGGAFARCEKLNNVDIVCDGELIIGKDAFTNCFQELQNGNTVNLQAKNSLVIRERAFAGCENLFEVEMNAGDDSRIDDEAFSACRNIYQMTIPSQTTTIGYGAFMGTESLVSLTIMPSVVSIGQSAFSRLGLIGSPLTIYGHKGSYIETYVAEHNKTHEGNQQIRFVEIECDHSSSNHRSEKDSDSVTRYRLNPNDESSHPNGHQTGDIYTRYCKDCGGIEETEILIWSTSLQPHRMSGGVCSLCGYKYSNKMPFVGTIYIGPAKPAVIGTEATYRAEISDDVELAGYMLYINDNPVDEGALSGKEDVVEFSTTELSVGEHYFKLVVYDKQGNESVDECAIPITIVGEETTDCRHTEYTDVYNPSIEIKYTDNKDGKTHIWQNGYDRICNACQVKFDVVYGAENTADHDYTNGNICPCGYDRSNCQHTPGEVKTYNRHIFAPFDAEQHQTTAIIWDMVCSSCGISYEVTDTEGDENNPVGLKYDHEWEKGKCKTTGCEYECIHPEKNKDGEENLKDKYLNTVSITDNKDGATHLHTYNVKRTCLICGHSWTEKLENVPEEHNIRDLDERGEYAYNTEEHWKVVPRGCSCSYLSGDSVIKSREVHTPQLIKTEIKYEPNANVYDVWEIDYYACECGVDYDPVRKYKGISGGSGNNGNDNAVYDEHYSVKQNYIYQEMLKPGIIHIMLPDYRSDTYLNVSLPERIIDGIILGIFNGFEDTVVERFSAEGFGALNIEQGQDYFGKTEYKKQLAKILGQLYVEDARYTDQNEFDSLSENLLSTASGNEWIDGKKGGVNDVIRYLIKEIYKDDPEGQELLLKEFDGYNDPGVEYDGFSKETGNVIEFLSDSRDGLENITRGLKFCLTDFSSSIDALKVYKEGLQEDVDPELVAAIDELIFEYENKTTQMIKEWGKQLRNFAVSKAAGTWKPYAVFKTIVDAGGALSDMTGLTDMAETHQSVTYATGIEYEMILGGIRDTDEKISRNEKVSDEEMKKYYILLEYVYASRVDQLMNIENDIDLTHIQKKNLSYAIDDLKKGLISIQTEKMKYN